LRISGDGAVRLELQIIFQNVHKYQLDPQVGSETNGGIHGVARPRGGACCHQNVTKHASLLSRVLPAALWEAGKARLHKSYHSTGARSQSMSRCYYCYFSGSLLWCPLFSALAVPAIQGQISKPVSVARERAFWHLSTWRRRTLCRAACTWRPQRHARKIVVPIYSWLYSEPRGCSR